MIEFDRVQLRYPDQDQPALSMPEHVVLAEGDLTLAVGPTGSGKSTLLRAVNGLVPHFTGGVLSGRVLVDGHDTSAYRPRDLAHLVAVVGQDPSAGFVTEVVEDEIAYGMEVLGVEPTAMRRRVEESMDVLDVADLRRRPLRELSGGQQQRVAIAAVLAAGPRILVLDEPTSALDPVSAENVLAAVDRLVHDLGVTVLMSEHRLERVVHHADQVLLLEDGRCSLPTPPAEAMAISTLAPPVVRVGRELGWSPLPLTVRGARRHAAGLLAARSGLEATPPLLRSSSAPGVGDDRPPPTTATETGAAPDPSAPPAPSVRGHGSVLLPWRRSRHRTLAPQHPVRTGPQAAVSVAHLHLRRRAVTVIPDLDLTLPSGSVSALMGRNGAGKSSLLACLAGLLPPTSGTVRLDAADPATLSAAEAIRHVALLPQDASDLVHRTTIAAECAAADRSHGLSPGTTEHLWRRLGGSASTATHPRDLSEGSRLLLGLAVVASGDPPVLLLDEPTRGLDYATKDRLAQWLHERAAAGTCVLMATHDVEMAATAADRAVLLAEGEVIAGGPARQILCHSPAFAPQMSKVAYPRPILTPTEFVDAVRAGSS
ncbi:ABC transporter ATP-binding protein [Dermacoccaceae bacterium W4C1]